MRIQLIAVGNRMPRWVREAWGEYSARLPRECRLELREITPGRRRRTSDAGRAMREEGERIRAAIPTGVRAVILDVDGRSWSTQELAGRLQAWMQDGRDVALVVGGPDGLDAEISALADERWSLSRLTLPHALVRVVVAEQLYRAWSVLAGHPYHRA